MGPPSPGLTPCDFDLSPIREFVAVLSGRANTVISNGFSDHLTVHKRRLAKRAK
jgi:hypothetical protein